MCPEIEQVNFCVEEAVLNASISFAQEEDYEEF